MKHLFVLALAALLGAQGMQAQESKKVEKFGIFDHMSIGVAGGTTGLGFELAAPITDFVQMRVGYHFLPKSITYTRGIDYTYTDKTDPNNHKPGTKGKTDVEFKLNMGNADILFDVYPTRKTMFHFTVGAFIGRNDLITAQNINEIKGVEEGEGLLIGDYVIGPYTREETDPKYGYCFAKIKTNKFKPYIGIGVGRAVPKKRVSVCGDFGVMFWGKPGVYAENKYNGDVKVTKDDIGDYNDGGAFKIMSKIIVYPMLTLRINGRIF